MRITCKEQLGLSFDDQKCWLISEIICLIGNLEIWVEERRYWIEQQHSEDCENHKRFMLARVTNHFRVGV